MEFTWSSHGVHMKFIWGSYEVHMDFIKSLDNGIKVIKIVENNNIYTSFSVYLVILAVTIYTIVHFFLYLLSYFLQY